MHLHKLDYFVFCLKVRPTSENPSRAGLVLGVGDTSMATLAAPLVCFGVGRPRRSSVWFDRLCVGPGLPRRVKFYVDRYFHAELKDLCCDPAGCHEGPLRSILGILFILTLKFFLFKKQTREEGGRNVDKFERTYYLNDPLRCLGYLG